MREPQQSESAPRSCCFGWKGVRVEAVAERLGTTPKRMSSWSKRFKTLGLAGLDDKPGRGRKPSIPAEKVARVVTDPPILSDQLILSKVHSALDRRFGSSATALGLAIQAAASAAVRRHSSARRQASSLARSEIALAFAGRWSEIRRMPAALRAAAIAALKAEQAAALSARLRYHLMRLRPDWRAEQLGLSRQHGAARRALAYRHKLAWAAASAAMKAFRPARAPPVARAGAPLLAAARP